MSDLREWYFYITGSHRVLLFYTSRRHGLDFTAKTYCTEHDNYIDVFSRHRWYHGNHNRDEVSLSQAWKPFNVNVKSVGGDAWLKNICSSQ